MYEEAEFRFAAREHPPGGDPGTWYVYLESLHASQVFKQVNVSNELKDPSRANAEQLAAHLQDAVRCLGANYSPTGKRERSSDN